jgi:hypothetical protein
VRPSGFSTSASTRPDQRADVGGPALWRHDAPLEPVEIEQVAEQPLQLARVRGHPMHEVERVGCRHLQPALFEREGRAEDRCQRRAEVVRDGLEERVLHLVEGAEPLGGLAFAQERLRVLPFRLAQGLLGMAPLGDVDGEPSELAWALAPADDGHQVAQPPAVAGRRAPRGTSHARVGALRDARRTSATASARSRR